MHDWLQGAWRGTVAAMAMSGMREVTVGLGLVERPPPDEIASAVAPRLLAAIPVRHRHAAIELAHWSFGAGMGVVYGALPARLRRSPLTGSAYGLAIWALYESAVAPMLGLGQRRNRPPSERVATAADHLLYGVVLGGRPHGSRAAR